MMEPGGEVVAGFKAVMPTYRGVLEEPEVAALVELMASLEDRPVAPSVQLPAVVPLPRPGSVPAGRSPAPAMPAPTRGTP
jgi:hypothetical protein